MNKLNLAERFIDAMKKNGIEINYFFVYDNKIKIGLRNSIIFECEDCINNFDYYGIRNNIGYRFRKNEEIKVDTSLIDRLIGYLHPYVNKIRENGQFLFINKKYRFNPGDITYFFPFLSFEEKGRESELLIRFTNKCNQNCEFCSSPIINEEPDINILKAIVEKILSDVKCQVTITGGEPSIRGELPDFIRWLLKKDVRLLRIQTNAVAFSNTKLIRRIPGSKKIQFFISLHSLKEEQYNAITSSKGQLNKAITGIKNIINSGYDTVVNVIINRYNLNTMDEYLERLYNTFGKDINVHFSVLILPEYRKNLEKYIVSYKDVVKIMIPLLEKYRIPINTLLSSTHASIPLCYLPEKYHSMVNSYICQSANFMRDVDTSGNWIKIKKCNKCKWEQYCIGVPALYYKIYNT